ncbi:uncharacterized protein [Macrobrachium rosenbergii]|uniref:uncharacterized protein n=1 Tax=Macrobrachium rosenbergii TaxID=79674 RepID=UPI0034D59A51
MMTHKVSFSVFVLILLCCDAKGDFDAEVSIGQKERQEYSRNGLLKNTTIGNSGKPVISPSLQTARYRCSPPYERIAKHCVHTNQFVGYGYGWEMARQYCKSLDGDLAWFENEDLPLIMDYFNVLHNAKFFIGGRRHNSTSDFEWVNGQKLPNTSSPLWDYVDNADWNCAIFHANGSYDYKISNQDCKAAESPVQFFVCRLPSIA